MSSHVDPLFAPFSIGGLTLPNRIVMAPMTRSSSPNGVPGPDVAAYYRRRAEHGVGLILSEGTAIDQPAAVEGTSIPRFHGEDALAGWAHVIAGVHEAGGYMMPQLWHMGMARKPGSEPNPGVPPIGPSGLTVTGEQVSEPMTETQVTDLVAAYAQGATEAARLGFDGIELHGAHGYLIDQFFWSGTNRRTDSYGGGLVARTRFAAEVVRACRRATAPEFPILLRFSQWKLPVYDAKLAANPVELEQFLGPLVEAGVNIFHCSTRRFWEPEFEGSPLNLAGWTRKLSGQPTITVGSVGLDADFIKTFGFEDGLDDGKAQGAETEGVERLVAMVARGEVDLVAVGRALLVDPAWAEKIREGRLRELVPFTPEALKTLA
jgi:2,4-dienoyl-CoA reductase-like NADH-dependent reductase (Old Yellow Enzyme family)